MQKPTYISVVGSDEEARSSLITVLSSCLRKRGYRVGHDESRQAPAAEEMNLIFLNNSLDQDIQKIEIAYENLRATNDMSIFAIVGQRKFRVGRPEFQSNEIEAMTDYLIEQFLKEHLLE